MKIIYILSILAGLSAYLFLFSISYNQSIDIGRHIVYLIFGVILGFNICGPGFKYISKNNSSFIAGIGSTVFFNSIALLVSLVSVILQFKEQSQLSYSLCIFSILLIAFSIGISKLTVTHVDSVRSGNSFTSDHLIWNDILTALSTSKFNIDFNDYLSRLANDSLYLTKDKSENKPKINSEIYDIIYSLKNHLESNQNDIALSECDKLKILFDLREISVKNRISN